MVIGDSQKNFVWKERALVTWTEPLVLPDDFIKDLKHVGLLNLFLCRG